MARFKVNWEMTLLGTSIIEADSAEEAEDTMRLEPSHFLHDTHQEFLEIVEATEEENG